MSNDNWSSGSPIPERGLPRLWRAFHTAAAAYHLDRAIRRLEKMGCTNLAVEARSIIMRLPIPEKTKTERS
jgi:hypothetical protein